MKRVKGYSVSVNDLLAGAASTVGLLLSVFTGRAVGGAVLDATGSLWLGACAWIGTILVGGILFFGGVAYVMAAPRTYRHPEMRSDGTRSDGTRAIERPMKVRT